MPAAPTGPRAPKPHTQQEIRATILVPGKLDIDGFPALVTFLEEGMARFEGTRHVVSDIELETDAAGRLRSVSRIEAWHRFTKDRPDLTIFGRYRNLYVRTDDGWRIGEHRGSEDRREQSPRS